MTSRRSFLKAAIASPILAAFPWYVEKPIVPDSAVFFNDQYFWHEGSTVFYSEVISGPPKYGSVAVIYNDDGSVRRMVSVEQFDAMEAQAEAEGITWGGS